MQFAGSLAAITGAAGGIGLAMGADEVARQAFDAVAARRLYVLPGHDGEADVAKAWSIACGRAEGTDPYPLTIEGMMRSLKRAEARATPPAGENHS